MPALVVFHQALRLALRRVPVPQEAAFILAVLLATGAGVVISRTIEQPLLRLGRRGIAGGPGEDVRAAAFPGSLAPVGRAPP